MLARLGCAFPISCNFRAPGSREGAWGPSCFSGEQAPGLQHKLPRRLVQVRLWVGAPHKGGEVAQRLLGLQGEESQPYCSPQGVLPFPSLLLAEVVLRGPCRAPGQTPCGSVGCSKCSLRGFMGSISGHSFVCVLGGADCPIDCTFPE